MKFGRWAVNILYGDDKKLTNCNFEGVFRKEGDIANVLSGKPQLIKSLL